MRHTQAGRSGPGTNPRAATALLLALLLAAPVRADDPARSRADDAVERGLAHLARTQAANGSWTAGMLGRNPAVTALSVMAFLSAGHVPGEGPYGKAVETGVAFVVKAQRPNGLIAPEDGGFGQTEMYTHGICTLMLAEVVGMTDAKAAPQVREALAKAVAVVLKGQRSSGPDKGGWRYSVNSTDADLSVTGWQLLALRAARNVGCDVPAEHIDWAVGYLRRCFDARAGVFCYQPNGPWTTACTGTGILGLELAGKKLHRAPESLRAGAFLIKNPPRTNGIFPYYGFYYCSQAMFQLGGNYWQAFRPLLHDELLAAQSRDGSWGGRTSDGSQFGTNYCTAMAVLALTVEYRLLPIYQRGEDSEDGK